MPSLNVAAELLAGVEDAIVVILVVKRPSEGVSKHPLCQRRQRIDRVVLQESRGVGGGPFGGGMVARCAELIELILGCDMSVYEYNTRPDVESYPLPWRDTQLPPLWRQHSSKGPADTRRLARVCLGPRS